MVKAIKHPWKSKKGLFGNHVLLLLYSRGRDCETPLDLCDRLRPCARGKCVGDENSYKCHCPLGYSGPTCQEGKYLLWASFRKFDARWTVFDTKACICVSAVTFTYDASFAGDGWLEIDRKVLRSNTDNEVISLGLTTNVSDALVLWYGQPPDQDGYGKDYLSLSSKFSGLFLDRFVKVVLPISQSVSLQAPLSSFRDFCILVRFSCGRKYPDITPRTLT